MQIYLVYAAAVLILVITVLLWSFFYAPISKIKNEVRRARSGLEKEWKIQGNYDFFLANGYKMFGHKLLNRKWALYLDDIADHKGKYKYSNIYEYLSPDKSLDEFINLNLTSIISYSIMIFGVVITGAVVAYIDLVGLLTAEMITIAVFTILGTALLSIVSTMYYRSLCFRARSQIRLFSQFIARGHNSMVTPYDVLTDIRMSLHDFRDDQTRFYAELSSHIAKTTKLAVRPYLENTKDVIERFVSAATTRHIESMKHLAEYFAKSTTEIYVDQIAKIAVTTAEMASIQERTAVTLETVNDIYGNAMDSIRLIGETTNNALTRNESYMSRVEEMQTSVNETVKELQDLVEYIRTNTKNKNFTIENISEFQKDLIDTSARSRESMQKFFDDFNDYYSSSLIALRSAAGDMLKSGEFLRNSYTDLTGSVNTEVTEVFRTFEENLGTISLHLSNSIHGLQDAIDDLPDILKQINVNVPSIGSATETATTPE